VNLLSPFCPRQSLLRLWRAVKQRLRRWAKPNNHLILNVAADLSRSRSELVLENAFLRQQLIILERQVKRPVLTQRDRVLFVLLASKLRSWKQALVIVQPDTLLRWHRDLFRWVWKRRSKPKQKGGRVPLADDIVALIKQLAAENRSWGAERIRGELLKLGLRVAKSTIQLYIRGVREPRSPQQNWLTFLRNHADKTWACDFLQTYDVFFRAIFVFVVVELGSRRVVHYGVTRHPTDRWVSQQLREATPFGEGPRFLIRDNDSKYGSSFGRATVGAGIEVLQTPYKAPKAYVPQVRRGMRTVYRQSTTGVPGPLPALVRAASASRGGGICRLLQLCLASSGDRAAHTLWAGTSRWPAGQQGNHVMASAGWFTSRIQVADPEKLLLPLTR
jgi:hypothetical protein